MKLSRLLSSPCDKVDEDASSTSTEMPINSFPSMPLSSSAMPDRLPPPSEDARGIDLVPFDIDTQRQRMSAYPNLHFSATFGPSASPATKKQSMTLPLAVKKRQSKPVASSSPVAKTIAKRKRSRKLSPKQMECWLEKEADNSQIYNLTLDVNELKQQVQDCEMQKSVCDTRMLIARYNHNGASMRIVDQFFKIFNDGYRDMNREEQGFLVSSTDDILSLGTVAYGRHFLFEQWERYTRIFHMRNFRNWSTVVMTNDPECTIVRCDGKFDGRISRETIETVFPHVLDDEELVQRVIGCKIRVPVQTLVYFDPTGRIVRYDAHVDVFQGLNDLLASNPRDVVTMMAHARINDASMIPDGPGEMPEEMPYERLSPSSPIPRFFPIEEEEEDSRLSLDYILS